MYKGVHIFFLSIIVCMIYILIVFCLVTILKFANINKLKPIIKSNNTLFLAKPKKAIYTSICLKLNFFSVKNSTINGLRTLKQTDHIISCVLYGNIKVYNKKINFDVLKNYGIDVNYPIIFIEKINMFTIKCLMLAKKYVKYI